MRRSIAIALILCGAYSPVSAQTVDEIEAEVNRRLHPKQFTRKRVGGILAIAGTVMVFSSLDFQPCGIRYQLNLKDTNWCKSTYWGLNQPPPDELASLYVGGRKNSIFYSGWGLVGAGIVLMALPNPVDADIAPSRVSVSFSW